MGAPFPGDAEITPEMIAAGVRVLVDEWGIIGPTAAEELAEEIFRAMLAEFLSSARSASGDMDSKP